MKHLDQDNMTSRSYGTESWLAGAGTLEERTQFRIRHCVFKKLSYFCAWLEILVRISTKVMQHQVLNGWPLFWAYNLFLSRKIHLTGGDGLEDIALTVICVFMIYSNGTSIGIKAVLLHMETLRHKHWLFNLTRIFSTKFF